MDTVDIIGWAVVILLGIGGWLFARHQQKSDHNETLAAEKRERIQKIVERLSVYLDSYAELIGLYNLYASKEVFLENEGIETSEADTDQKRITIRYHIEPDQRLAKAIESLKGAELKDVIDQQIAQIHLKDNEVHDLLLELEPEGFLDRMLRELQYLSIDGIEDAIKQRDTYRFFYVITQADNYRNQLRGKIAFIAEKKSKPR